MSVLDTFNINSDDDIKKYIYKAKILGLPVFELNTECEHKIYLVSKTKTNHIILIPSDVEAVYRMHSGGDTYNILANLKGTITVYGGWGLTTLELLFHTSSANKIDISNIQIPNVDSMSHLFSYSDATEIIIKGLDTSSVAFIDSMFYNSCIERVDMSDLNFTNVEYAADMFTYSALQELNMNNVHLANNAKTTRMFDYCNFKLIAQDRLILKAYKDRLLR